MNDDLVLAEKIAREAERAGGRVCFVGGCVRDRLLGRPCKDLDLEVHGVSVETLERILDSLGERIAMGASFGVMGLKHCGLDIAMPRSEQATGRGHKDFAVFVDPFLGEEKAASRRDFTVNALMQDVLTGEVLDFFGGREDLERKVLRHVSDDSFPEDPLRVFRAAQFAARFGFTVAPETRTLCSRMTVDALPGERVMGELEKALLQAERPSVFFEELRKMGQLSVWFPEVQALIGVPQPPRYHPEGDVWNHTMQVLDEAARLRERAERPLPFMFSALCHDLGKPAATAEIDGKLHAYGHEREGLTVAERFLRRLTRETKLIDYVLNMTALHMEPNKMADTGAGTRAFMRLYDRALCPEDLLLLAKADGLGCLGPGQDRAEREKVCAEREAKLLALLTLYRERMAAPCVTGKDLLEAGAEPGPRCGEALAYVRKLRLAGVSKEEQLRQAIGFLHAKSC